MIPTTFHSSITRHYNFTHDWAPNAEALNEREHELVSMKLGKVTVIALVMVHGMTRMEEQIHVFQLSK